MHIGRHLAGKRRAAPCPAPIIIAMLELIQITSDPALARRCDAIEGMRLFVDLERNGKAERQAGRNTFISAHCLDDVGRIRQVVRRSKLMVRINPWHRESAAEIEAVLAQKVDLVMLPMATLPTEVREFASTLKGRVPGVVLLETEHALGCLEEWIDTPGLSEVYLGLNDLHIALGLRFMFEPLASGIVDRVAVAARQHGLRFGFGGIARLDEGLLPGRDVLAEHQRVASQAVILSRTFHRSGGQASLEGEVAALREAEVVLARRTPHQVDADRLRIAQRIAGIAAGSMTGS
jgi:hypothetical protein